MFEHFSFRVPRYGEDAVRKNPLNRKVKFICAPEFKEIYNSLFGGVDFDNMMNEAAKEAFKPRVVCVPRQNKEPEEPKKEEPPFRWYTEDDDEDDEDEEPVKVPPSIFDMLNSGKNFGDIVSAKPKHTDIYNQAFGLDDDGNEIEPPEDEDEDEEDVETETKNPFVFIANRLTFLAQTVQPIIFDTSLIETGSDYIKIAINEDKTFPKIMSFDELGLITCKLNCCQTIRDEIGEFIKGTEYTDIFCFPEFISRDGPGTDVWAIKFICYKRK